MWLRRITTLACLWQRTNRSVLGMFRRVIKELRVLPNEWDSVCGLIQYAVNATPRDSLNGLAPADLFLGYNISKVPFISTLFPNLTEVEIENGEKAIKEEVEKFIVEKEKLKKEQFQMVMLEREKRKAKLKLQKRKPFSAAIGKMVFRASRTRRNKLESTWIGPFIIRSIQGHKVTIESIQDGHQETVHVGHLREYTPNTEVPEEMLKEQAGYLEEGFLIDTILEVAQDEQDNFLCLVKWDGYDDTYNTWEPALTIYPVAKEKVDACLATLGKKEEKLFAKFIKKNLKNLGGVV
jgi:hypothetical protein